MGKKLEDGRKIIKPFLKWAGGKRWFAEKHGDIFDVKYNRYIEPFLGSGAIFFKLQPQNALLSDRNEDLIDTYRALKQDWKEVEKVLRKHHKNHCKEYYYKIRQSRPQSLFTKAARFIYLNRTCWNGLYRVSRQGKFNVPIGTSKNVVLDTDNFEQIAKVLKKINLVSADFEAIIDCADKDDLLFVDPPYTVKHNNNGFISYNESLFSWNDQVRLAESLRRAHKRGVKIVLTNASHDSIRKLYHGDFELSLTSRPSVLAANPKNRKICEELIVTNI